MTLCVSLAPGTLFLILLGEFDFDEMAEVSWPSNLNPNPHPHPHPHPHPNPNPNPNPHPNPNQVSWLWATLFFLIYVIFMFFVVLNIFLAILNDAYTVRLPSPHPHLTLTPP